MPQVNLPNILIGLGGLIMAVVTLLQGFGILVLSRDAARREVNRYIKIGKTQSEAESEVSEYNSRIKNIYNGFMFVGTIMLAWGGLYK